MANRRFTLTGSYAWKTYAVRDDTSPRVERHRHALRAQSELVRDGHVLTSISDYYYTPVRSLFVGALIGVAACMIALRGNTDTEDKLLNLRGMLAPAVAFIPTTPNPQCTPAPRQPCVVDIANNIGPLLAVGAVALRSFMLAFIDSDVGPRRPRPCNSGFEGGSQVMLTDLITEYGAVAQQLLPREGDPHVTYDFIIVGSGFGGGLLASALADAGASVLLLEAGSYLFPTHVANLPRQVPIGQFDKNVWHLYQDFGVSNYQNVGDSNFQGAQAFNLGGRSVFWGGLIPRQTQWQLDSWPHEVADYLLTGAATHSPRSA